VLVWQALVLTVLSYAVGVLGGFVGMALGTIRLPAMLLLGMPALTAGGTNILVSTLSAVAGSLRHLREGRVDRELVLWMGLPSVAGAAAGGFLSASANEGALLTLVALFVAWQGVEFARLAQRQSTLPDAPAERRAPNKTLEAAIGLVIGALGGAIGLILGSVRLPALIRILGVDPRRAVGTNLFIGMLTGIAGWLGHVAIGAVDMLLLLLLASSGMAGQLHGARLTGRAPIGALLYTIAAVLVIVGVLLLREGLLRLV
jgi:uncharacterized membrane protein YfcA